MQLAAQLRKQRRIRRIKSVIPAIASFAVATYLLRIGHPDAVKNLSMVLLILGFGGVALATIAGRRAARRSFEFSEREAAYRASLAAQVSPGGSAQIQIEKPDSAEPRD